VKLSRKSACWLDSGGDDTLGKMSYSVALFSDLEMPEQRLTRRAMYDLVWSRPMTKVAADFGISDVALKKICDKHRVPTPPRGYWAKRDAGKPTKQIQFHSTADPQHEHIVIHRSRNNLAPEVREVLEQERQRRKSKPKAALPAEVASTILPQDVHPSISATAKALRKAKPGRRRRGEWARMLRDRGWRRASRTHDRRFGFHRTGA
jgi:hypothetical protein